MKNFKGYLLLWSSVATAFSVACAQKPSPLPLPPPTSEPGACTRQEPEAATPQSWERVFLAGELGRSGFFDPSVASHRSGSLFMSYTSVESGQKLHTRVAQWTGPGAQWMSLGDVNQEQDVILSTSEPSLCGAAQCEGTWVYETSSLVFDLDDPDLTRAVKVFSHSYFVTAQGRIAYQVGAINLHTSAFPPGTGGWKEEKLLGWNSSSPRSSEDATFNITTDASLSKDLGGCLLLSEPGALVHRRNLDLALGCVLQRGNRLPIEIQLLRSQDHGRTWRFVSTLLSEADAQALGAQGPLGAQLNAAHLFLSDLGPALLVSPNGPVGQEGGYGYTGCLTLTFENLDTGTLRRCEGVPALSSSLFLPESGGGACSPTPTQETGGVLVSVPHFKDPRPFRILATNEAAF